MPGPDRVSSGQGLDKGSVVTASTSIRSNTNLIDVANLAAKLVGPIRNQQGITFDAAIQLQHRYYAAPRIGPQLHQRVSDLVNSHRLRARVFLIERKAHVNDEIILVFRATACARIELSVFNSS